MPGEAGGWRWAGSGGRHVSGVGFDQVLFDELTEKGCGVWTDECNARSFPAGVVRWPKCDLAVFFFVVFEVLLEIVVVADPVPCTPISSTM